MVKQYIRCYACKIILDDVEEGKRCMGATCIECTTLPARTRPDETIQERQLKLIEQKFFEKNALKFRSIVFRPINSFNIPTSIPNIKNCNEHHIRAMVHAIPFPESKLQYHKDGLWFIFPTMDSLVTYCEIENDMGFYIKNKLKTIETRYIPLVNTV